MKSRLESFFSASENQTIHTKNHNEKTKLSYILSVYAFLNGYEARYFIFHTAFMIY